MSYQHPSAIIAEQLFWIEEQRSQSFRTAPLLPPAFGDGLILVARHKNSSQCIVYRVVLPVTTWRLSCCADMDVKNESPEKVVGSSNSV